MALDADSKKFLDEVKKGKPRRFAMVMKGEKIVSLVVYKKGSLEKYKKQAKDEGKGQFFHGVIDGKGQGIVFKLCREDGFEQAPGKDVKLKAYLKEVAGMQFKPTYEIVDVLPSLTDGPGSEESGASPPAAAPTEPVAEQPVAAAPSGLATKLLEALSKMTPLIKQAIATQPTQKAVILKPASDIKTAVENGQLDQAKSDILQYGAFLKRLIAEGAATTPDVSTPSTETATQATPAAATPTGDSSADAPTGLRAWQAARQDAVDQLTSVAKAIAATKDPDARPAIIQLQSIIKNLTPAPETPEQIAELDRYLRDDDVITAAEEAPPAFGPIVLRDPLLKALATLAT